MCGHEETATQLEEKTCAKCGKVFIPAPFHRFYINYKWYCSWTCYNHRNDVGKGATDER